MTYPYDDTILTYDFQAHRYLLTASGCEQMLGVNLNDVFQNVGDESTRQRRIQRFLQKVTNTVYGYIYESSWNNRRLEYELACNETLRQPLQTMLLEMAEYALDNNFLQDFSGVNIEKGTAMRKEDLRGQMRVPEIVVEMCNNEYLGNLGFTLHTVLPVGDVPANLYRVGY